MAAAEPLTEGVEAFVCGSRVDASAVCGLWICLTPSAALRAPPPPEGEESNCGEDLALYGYPADRLFGDDHASGSGVFEPGWAVDGGL